MATYGNITTLVKNGQLGRTSENKDSISALLSFNSIATGTTIAKYTSIEDIENAGITETSNYKNEWYQSKSYFEQNINGTLYLQISPSAATYDFSEIESMQNFASGDIRNVAVIVGSYGFNVADIADFKTVAENLANANRPLLNILYSPNVISLTSTTTLDNLTDLRDGTYNNRWLSIVIGGDYSNKGKSLETTLGYTVSSVGAILGILSKASVSDSPAAVGLYNLTQESGDFVEVQIGKVPLTSVSISKQKDIHDKGYIFLRNITDFGGTFVSGAPVITPIGDDYDEIQHTRVMYKAVRLAYQALVPFINTKIKQENGIIAPISAAIFESAVQRQLDTMLIAEELTYPDLPKRPVAVLPQDIVTTGKVVVNIAIKPYGYANTIEANLGFTA